MSAAPEVREWQIAVLHRERAASEGTCAGVTWTRGDPQPVDRNMQVFRDQLMPQLVNFNGFCSVSLFIDRA